VLKGSSVSTSSLAGNTCETDEFQPGVEERKSDRWRSEIDVKDTDEVEADEVNRSE